MHKPSANITLNLLKHYADHLQLELSLSDNSVEAYRYDVHLFLQHLEAEHHSTEVNDIKQDTIARLVKLFDKLVPTMHIEGVWYLLTAKPDTYNDSDPTGVLDVTILSNLVLDKVLGIKGLGEMKVAFALYPVSMKQIIDIADTGNIMPPKTTWFEPKLRSGLVIHTLD